MDIEEIRQDKEMAAEKKYIWEVQEAERNKEGSAMGEMVMGRKEEREIERQREQRVERGEEIMIEKLCLGESGG